MFLEHALRAPSPPTPLRVWSSSCHLFTDAKV